MSEKSRFCEGWTGAEDQPVLPTYLQELDVVLGASEALQRAVGFPELRRLPLDLLQQLLGLADGHLLLEPDQLLGLAAALLHGVDEFGEDPLALLGRRFRRVLQRSARARTVSAPIDGKNKNTLTLM